MPNPSTGPRKWLCLKPPLCYYHHSPVAAAAAAQFSAIYLNISTIVALLVFFTLLCACIIIGHLLQENRWLNDSIIALFLVLTFFTLFLLLVFDSSWHMSCQKREKKNHGFKFNIVFVWLKHIHMRIAMQGLCSGLVVLVVSKFHSTKLLTFNEDLFFLYLLPPIIFNAGFDFNPFYHDDDQMQIKITS